MNSSDVTDAYHLAQRGITDLKAAVYLILANRGKAGLRNVDVGRALGIYGGHVGHEGHVSRTILAIMEAEGVVHQQSEEKTWSLVDQPISPNG